MKFNSIFDIVYDDEIGVYGFLEQVFVENGIELTGRDRNCLVRALREFVKKGKKDFRDFISLFGRDDPMYDILNELGPGGQYGFFADNSSVDVTKMDGVPLSLVAYYSDHF